MYFLEAEVISLFLGICENVLKWQPTFNFSVDFLYKIQGDLIKSLTPSTKRCIIIIILRTKNKNMLSLIQCCLLLDVLQFMKLKCEKVGLRIDKI